MWPLNSPEGVCRLYFTARLEADGEVGLEVSLTQVKNYHLSLSLQLKLRAASLILELSKQLSLAAVSAQARPPIQLRPVE